MLVKKNTQKLESEILDNAGLVSDNVDSKAALAGSFGRAAEEYDRAAHLQKRVGSGLLQRLKSSRLPGEGGEALMDLGCGTGFFGQALAQSFQPKSIIFADISINMLSYAQIARSEWDQKFSDVNASFLQLDAESMVLRPNSIDLIFSSLALQWVADLGRVLRNVEYALQRGGVMGFSTLLDGSLRELKESWSTVDSHQHVNSFLSMSECAEALKQSKLQVISAEQVEEVVPYAKPVQLMRDLKAIGAHNIAKGRPKAMVGKAKLAKVLEHYETFRRPDDTVPATYEVGYFLLRKGA